MNAFVILSAIPYTEPATFNELLAALSDRPDDSEGWHELFETLEMLEGLGLIEVERAFNNRIDSVQLTEEGVAHVRDKENK